MQSAIRHTVESYLWAPWHPLCGAPLRPQDVRVTREVVAIARVPEAQDAPGGIYEG